MTYNKKNPIARLIMRSSVKKRLYFERKNQSSSKNLLHMLLTAAKQYKGTINLLLNKIKASALILIASPVFAAHFANTFGTTALDTITLGQREQYDALVRKRNGAFQKRYQNPEEASRCAFSYFVFK